MTVPQRRTGSAEPLPEEHAGTDHLTKEPSGPGTGLRALIQSRKETEKQLSTRLSLVQAIIEGADLAIFSVDTQGCYTSFNQRHARDVLDLYGSEITIGKRVDSFVPGEKDRRKILGIIRQALAGERGGAGEYFGDSARSRRFFDLSWYPVNNDPGIVTGAAVIAADATARKQGERALADQEERFRRLVENTPDLFFRLSLPGRDFEYISPAAETITGYPSEEFLKKPGLLYELVHPAGKDAFGRLLDDLVKGNKPPAAEFPVFHRNGNLRWWMIRTTPVHDAAGHPIAAEGIATDITDRRTIETALKETEERYRKIFDSADAGIVLIDADTHMIADANPRALGMIGAPCESVLGAVCHRFICPTEKGRCPVTDLKEHVDESERAVLTADGRTVPVLKTVVPVTIAGRNLLIESFIDLSTQKKTENALRESDDRYRAFIANSSEGIYRFAADCGIPVSLPPDEQIALFLRDGYIAECNDAMARMYGYERAGELAGQKLETIIDAGDPRILEYLRKFIRDGYQVTDYETGERDRNGDIHWFSSTMNGVIHDGQVVHLWGVRRDITDRRKAEMTLRESEERYRDLIEQSLDIIYTVSFSGIVTSVSPAVTQLLGYNPDELINTSILDYFRPEARQRVLEDLERRKSGEWAESFYQVEIRAKDGRFVPFEVNVTTRTNSCGTRDIIGMAREISERKKAEDALRESEEKFRSLLQGVPSVAVQGFLPDYTITYWNEASTRMFGYQADEAMGKDIRDLLLPAGSRDEVTRTCDRMAATGEPGPSAELDLLGRDGVPVPVFVSHAVVKIPKKSTQLFCIGVDLTERKTAEKALRDAERRLQSILDAAPFGTHVYELRDNGDLVFVSGNQSADRILGIDCGRFVGMTITDAFPALGSTGIPDEYRRVAAGGDPFHLDGLDYRNGEFRGIFEIHAVQLIQNRVAVFFRDISEKKKAEQELEQSETRFRALIQNSSDIIQILDREKRLVYNSPALSKILGYLEGSRNGTPFLELIHPDDRARVAADLDMVYIQANPGTPTEYRMLTLEGNYRYVESIGVNLLGIPGVDGIVINTHTVHERKQAEQALQESEERFRLIFQYSNDSMYLFEITSSGMPGKIVDANEVAVRETGYARDELVRKSLPELCSRDLFQRSRAVMMELLTRGEARFETEMIKKDGTLLPVEISARLAKIRDKAYVIAISRDISRRKREDRALRIANQKLQLMNIVAWHDIQNKVTGLRGYVELSKDLATDEKLKKFIDSEEDVLRVIHRQLQYTREYQEMGIHPPQWVNLPKVLRMIVSFTEIGALKFHVDIGDLELYCDPVIEKVFSHLIENTLKHGKKASGIRISCRETAHGLSLIYEDDGVGIARDKKKDLFVRGVGSATGFSLFFVHDILEISDMGIQETGEPGTGARFEISVPRGLYRIGRVDT